MTFPVSRALLTMSAALALGIPSVQAQTFPDRAVTIIVPFGAGSRTDIVARALANELSPVLKQPVVVENRSGANQIVGGSFVARSAPNGYTLLMVTLPSVMSPAALKSLPFQSLTEFAPVASIVKAVGMFVIGADVPAKDLKEFVTLLKANPGKYAYGSGGNGSPLHLACEMFNYEAGTTMINVPYKSINAVMMDIVAGHIHFGYVTLGAMQFVQTGKLKVIGLSGTTRSPLYPNVPTVREQGLSNFEYAANYAISAPKGTPAPVIGILNAAVNKAIATEGFVSKMRPEEGLEVFKAQTPEQTGALIAAEEARWNDLVKRRNIQID